MFPQRLWKFKAVIKYFGYYVAEWVWCGWKNGKKLSIVSNVHDNLNPLNYF